MLTSSTFGCNNRRHPHRQPITSPPRNCRNKTAPLVVVVLLGLYILTLPEIPETATTPETELESLWQQAEEGDVAAQIGLGAMDTNEEGVPQDDAEAVRWYRLAAGGSTER